MLDPQPSKPLSPISKPTTARLVQLENWHFHHFLSTEEAESLGGRAFGRTLVSGDGIPLGFGGCYFDNAEDGTCVVMGFFYGGPDGYFMRKYMSLAVRAFIESMEIVYDMGIGIIYCICDRNIKDADKLIRWCGGEPTGVEDPNGEVWAIHLDKSPLLRRRRSGALAAELSQHGAARGN